jgi:hypothetical protein
VKVLLTFDVEVWCNGWDQLDAVFPSSFERYVYGRSKRGDYALPKTLEILNAHDLRGVFFVEPLFAARFGFVYLRTIVDLIRNAGQDVQLHLHPEWVDEISPSIIPDNRIKRPHMGSYTLAEQQTLISQGKQMLLAAGGGPINAFRAGNFSCNRDTFHALRANDIFIDSSVNAHYDESGSDLPDGSSRSIPSVVEGVSSFPVSLFTDGLGKVRPVQVGSCGFGELCEVMESAAASGQSELVVVSHNFEMLKPDSSQADSIVVSRFERLCRYLGENRHRLPTAGYADCSVGERPVAQEMPHCSVYATLGRHIAQLSRRF